MKLTAKTDLEAPIRFVYATLADFPAWEREAVRHGVEIEEFVFHNSDTKVEASQ